MPMEESIDVGDCMLIGLRSRLNNPRREVPAVVWAEMKDFLVESPGLLRSLTPNRVVEESSVSLLVASLLFYRDHIEDSESVHPRWQLVCEGLTAALHHGHRRLAGSELLWFIDYVVDPARVA